MEDLGGTLRLGLYPCKLTEGTKAYEAYNDEVIYERHRHRYEFNNEYRQAMEEAGFMFSGTSPDGRLVEIIELKDHPWFVHLSSTQNLYHVQIVHNHYSVTLWDVY